MIKRVLSHPLVQKHGSKFMRFAVCGGLGACIDFGSLWFMVNTLGWPEKYAFIVSTGLAMIFVFISNRFFTFKSTDDARGQAIKFFMVYFFAAALNYGLSLSFFLLGVHYILSKALAIGIIMFFNYFCLNRFVFKPKEAIASEVIAA